MAEFASALTVMTEALTDAQLAIRRMGDERTGLLRELTELQAEVTSLTADRDALRAENEKFRAANSGLIDRAANLREVLQPLEIHARRHSEMVREENRIGAAAAGDLWLALADQAAAALAPPEPEIEQHAPCSCGFLPPVHSSGCPHRQPDSPLPTLRGDERSFGMGAMAPEIDELQLANQPPISQVLDAIPQLCTTCHQGRDDSLNCSDAFHIAPAPQPAGAEGPIKLRKIASACAERIYRATEVGGIEQTADMVEEAIEEALALNAQPAAPPPTIASEYVNRAYKAEQENAVLRQALREAQPAAGSHERIDAALGKYPNGDLQALQIAGRNGNVLIVGLDEPAAGGVTDTVIVDWIAEGGALTVWRSGNNGFWLIDGEDVPETFDLRVALIAAIRARGAGEGR
jgi:hypothetical protein